MKPTLLRLLAAGIAALGIGCGCAGRQASQDVARLTLRQTAQMENQLSDKMRAETEYYQKRQEGLLASAQGALAVDLSNYIRVQADAVAEQAAAMPGDRPMQVSQVRDLLRQMLLGWESQRAAEFKSIEELTVAMRQAVQSLSAKSLELAKLREKIEPLQEKEKPLVTARELYQFYRQLDQELKQEE